MDPGNYAMQHVSRRFNGSPERVFEAWTDARQIKRWLEECGCDPSSVKLVLGIGEAFNVRWAKYNILENFNTLIATGG